MSKTTQAKLKKIICNPNAPELVHFLFKPLSLVVNTSPDSNQCSGLDLAKNVANPLITDEVGWFRGGDIF